MAVVTAGSPGAVDDATIEQWHAAYASNDKNLLATNAVCVSDVADVLLNRDSVVDNTDVEFDHRMQYDEAKATDQKSTGRCWIFAATNVIRLHFIKKFGLSDSFEFSQPYLFFWDKLEKANYFLESIIKTRSEPLDSRLVHHLLSTPINDGGQYDMIINLISKHGLVPKSAFPESKHSCNSRRMNQIIITKLREFAQVLRDASKASDESALRAIKSKQMSEIYSIMCIFFGIPPKQFTWSFRNKEKKYVEHPKLTPLTFVGQLIDFDVTDMVSLISDPRNPYYKLYTVDYLGNVVGGRDVRYINVPIEVLNELAARSIEGGEPVWFGCDVGKHFHREMHVMDLGIFNYNLVFNTKFNQNREQRLRYGQSLMTHAMVFNAFHGEVGNVSRWRVENSWSDKNNKGFATMTNDWFNEYVYQIVVNKSLLSPEILAVYDQVPTVLPPWDPMGSLAN
ncbi:bleomycin hydrolase [Plasmodiophora brassicae]|uniref:bleomycin hydrolase n=1 Tax=Plasmodiophora brassicae TaxID=37360 RepID=A0A3P3YN58_PLABS|nr:unnamed protein product [Plasmodiophora brassicae]